MQSRIAPTAGAFLKSELDLICYVCKRLLSRIYDGPTLFKNVLRPKVSYSCSYKDCKSKQNHSLNVGHGSSSALVIGAHICCPLHRVEKNQRHGHTFLEEKNIICVRVSMG